MMIRIRVLEEGIEKHFLAGDIPGFAHLSIGQEAVAAGVCAQLRRDDYIASTHRGHGHALAKGTSMRSMVAELFARETGVCRGKGGSMHIADFSVGMLGANGVVAGGFGLVAGAALSAVQRKTDQVAVCFFGDGATNRGPFHENLNLAAVWSLPAIFVLENNRYASTTSTAETMKIDDVAIRADGYGIPAQIVDGFDAFAIAAALETAVRRARDGGGPTFIECKTYRVRGHYIGDPEKYRTKNEAEDVMKSDDPIVRMQATLAERLDAEEFEALWNAARAEFADAVAFALASPVSNSEDAFFGVYSGDREAGNPVNDFERSELERLMPFAAQVPSGSQGGAH
ncbi:MAG: thiamine pyrophosphate-dependent dehydrogenase E1 component subunit alpha [Candidatus Eremiobacteraeota bacterium]|nr:thiamine pyrophosphate-dependent dehydrogenase E1 component subunit alpha [Candidatus Eremiobacteraeota bacterium]